MSRPESRRQAQAAETRTLVLDAALRLFAEQGYAATSVADIAREAGVALPTVYASVGAKPVLLRLLSDRIDERAGIPDLHAATLAAEDPREVLALVARLTRQLAERCGDVIAAMNSAAGAAPELAALVAEGDERHRAGAHGIAHRIDRLGGLRRDVPVERAASIVDALTQPDMYTLLVRRHGWSFDEAEAWVTEALAGQLLA